MPKRSSIKRPRDLNQLAAAIVGEATGDAPSAAPADDGKDPHAVALGRKGGAKGGSARAAALTSDQRKEIAKRAAAARWQHRSVNGAHAS